MEFCTKERERASYFYQSRPGLALSAAVYISTYNLTWISQLWAGGPIKSYSPKSYLKLIVGAEMKMQIYNTFSDPSSRTGEKHILCGVKVRSKLPKLNLKSISPLGKGNRKASGKFKL